MQDWLMYQSDQGSNLGFNSDEAALLLAGGNASDTVN